MLLFIWELGVYAVSFFPVLGMVAVLGEGLLLGFIHFVLAHLFFRFSVAIRMTVRVRSSSLLPRLLGVYPSSLLRHYA